SGLRAKSNRKSETRERPVVPFCTCTLHFALCPLLSPLLQNLSRAIDSRDDSIQAFFQSGRVAIVQSLPEICERLRRIAGENSRRIDFVFVPGPTVQAAIIDERAFGKNEGLVYAEQFDRGRR